MQTKLYIPPASATLVARPRLLQRLEAVWRNRLTLVAAPAGFGKTTLVAAWCAEPQAAVTAGGQPGQVAWLSLEAGDNDLSRFFLYCIAALQTIAPTCGRQTQALLYAPQPTATETLLTLLLNEMAALTAPFVVVLDDYHLITTPAIHEALTRLVDHLPPMVHLLIISRTDPPFPLARWRVRGQLSEVRAADLRFTRAEVQIFFQHSVGVQLTDADLATLATRTEGWIAALQLAALSLQGQADLSRFLQSFSGGQRHIVDYLVDEVLSRQPPAIQHFLLQTAILEQFCAPLCAAVLSETTQSVAIQQAQLLLEQLERSNLFLIPLDSRREWFRYHALFAEFLRHRLGPAPELHQRAAAWYGANGFVEEAIEHTLAAQQLVQAADLIELHSLAFSLRHQMAVVQRWLDALPREWRQQRLGLALSEVWLMLGRGDVRAMALALQAVDRLVANAPLPLEPAQVGEVAAAHALVASFQQNERATIAYAQQALASLPLQALQLRLAVLSGLGYGYYCAGDLLAAEETLRTALAASTGTTTTTYTVLTVTLLSMLGMTVEVGGRLPEAVDLFRQALALAQVEERYLPAAGVEVALHALGLRLYEFNDLAAAEHYIQIARDLSLATGNIMIQAHTLATLSLITQAKGDDLAAQALIDEAYRLLQPIGVPSNAIIEGQRLFLWWKRGELSLAGAWAEHFAATLPSRPQPMTAFATPYFSLARIWLAQGRFAEADALLADLHRAAAASHYHYYALWALILRCRAYAAQGKRACALTMLDQAVHLAAPVGYIRSFLDEGSSLQQCLTDYLAQRTTQDSVTTYVEQLLTAFAVDQLPSQTFPPTSHLTTSVAKPSVPATLLVETLSTREVEVLRLLERGLSNQAIADELIVALSTVKKHLINIYGKLGVNSRTQALTRARTAGLL
ncbi:MAG: hypothetical protein KF832_16940 [Caldilineaceae bacterium]|nr:hypothetical protein [Caldilineaceae bacterium]